MGPIWVIPNRHHSPKTGKGLKGRDLAGGALSEAHPLPAGLLTSPPLPSGAFDPPMANSTNNIIVLDDDDEDEATAAAQPGPSHPPPSPASHRAEAPGSSQPPGGTGGSTSSGSKKCFKLENKKLFDEVSFGEKVSSAPVGGGWCTGLVLSPLLTHLTFFLSPRPLVSSPTSLSLW